MYKSDYLNGNVYHMTHIKNLRSILQEEALYSKRKIWERAITMTSIANEHVQYLRERIFIHSKESKQNLTLHDFVPFYFATRTSMLRSEDESGLMEAILIFEFDRKSILREPGVLFTDGNASNQLLTRNGGEYVLIEPASVFSGQCIRKYIPSGPHGTSDHLSNFYADQYFLDQLNWNVINNRRTGVGDARRQKQAEVLVPNSVSLKWLRRIVVSTQRTAGIVCEIVDASKAGRKYDIHVEIMKGMFFRQQR